MADFSQVKSIQTTTFDGRGILQIKIAGAVDPLTITSSPSEVEDMADLIDGYCRLVHDINTSLWTRKGRYFMSISVSFVYVGFCLLSVYCISCCCCIKSDKFVSD
jgi:focal adhesion kinase 1